ncbi:MAG: Glycosyltransferase [Rhodobacteraceae bacterium HLUCCA08]|nr:MAG: Glycosyltransferase [Rhodobacteraceae bacterium HLUCCA08]
MKRILFVQHGDFRADYKRLQAGEAEAYRDQKRSVDFAAGLADGNAVTVLRLGPEDYDEMLAPQLQTIGIDKANLTAARASAVMDRIAPTHLVLRSPRSAFLLAAARRGTFVLPSFADIFQSGGPGSWLRHRHLRHLLDRCRAPCVANHSLNASRSLAQIVRIDAARIVPWDWSKVPLAGPPKPAPVDPREPTLFYAGSLVASKGVGDLIDAVAALDRLGLQARATIAGPGDATQWRAYADTRGVGDRISFPGRIPNSEVRAAMRASDFVVVPSRPDYPEGLPNVIYEGLASRSVVALSDHPAFAGRLDRDRHCLVFKAADPTDLATQIARACADPGLYRAVSSASEDAHESLYLGMEWTGLVTTFLDDPEDRTGWVAPNSLAALG